MNGWIIYLSTYICIKKYSWKHRERSYGWTLYNLLYEEEEEEKKHAEKEELIAGLVQTTTKKNSSNSMKYSSVCYIWVFTSKSSKWYST